MQWQPEDQIDSKLFRLIDPDQPLQKNDIFLPGITSSSLEITWNGFWLGLFIIGVTGISYNLFDAYLSAAETINNKQHKGMPVVVSVLLLFTLGFGAFRAWQSLKNRLIQRKLIKTGRYRTGMFILNNAILVHYLSQIFFVEKKNIDDFQIIRKGRGDPSELLMIVQTNDKERISINLHDLQLKYTAEALKPSLSHWLKTGKWNMPDS